MALLTFVDMHMYIIILFNLLDINLEDLTTHWIPSRVAVVPANPSFMVGHAAHMNFASGKSTLIVHVS